MLKKWRKGTKEGGRASRVDGGGTESEGQGSILALLDCRAETDIPDMLRSRFYDRAQVQGEWRTEEAEEGAG